MKFFNSNIDEWEHTRLRMTHSPYGISMMLYRVSNTILVSEGSARVIAEAIVRDYWGEDDLSFQSPLDVRDDGEVWSIEGTGRSTASQSRMREPAKVG